MRNRELKGAKLGYWRITERMLFATIIFGGAVGALLSMRLCHHKTRKRGFIITTYLSIILQLSLIALYFVKWRS